MSQTKSARNLFLAALMAVMLAVAGVMLASTQAHADAGKIIKAGDVKIMIWPDELKRTKSPAIYYCGPVNKNKTSYTVPKTVKFKYKGKSYTGKVFGIENEAFKGCNKARTITIKPNVGFIGIRTFYKCKNLQKVKAKDYTISGIGASAFEGCKKLTSIPKMAADDGFMMLDKRAFKDCVKLKEITIKMKASKYGDGSIMIFERAFENCKALKKVALSKPAGSGTPSLEIGKNAFKGCKKLTAITNFKRYTVQGEGADMAGTPLAGKLA